MKLLIINRLLVNKENLKPFTIKIWAVDGATRATLRPECVQKHPEAFQLFPSLSQVLHMRPQPTSRGRLKAYLKFMLR